MHLNQIEWQVLLTIAYCDQFNYPLSIQEINQRLIGIDSLKFLAAKFGLKTSHSNLSSAKKSDLQLALSSLVSKQLINERGGVYCLYTREKFFNLRKQRQARSINLHKEVEWFVQQVSGIGWIEAMVVTGSLAMLNIDEDHDIDLMIITKSKRIWIVRTILLFILFIHGKKRPWRSKNKWCLNLWLEKDNLKLSSNRQTIFSAYELLQSRWVFDRAKLEKEMLIKNNWAESMLPYYWQNKMDNLGKDMLIKDRISTTSSSKNRFLDTVNMMLFFVQTQYLKFKVGLRLNSSSYSQAFLHHQDLGKQVMKRWGESVFSVLNERAKKYSKILATGVFDVLHKEHLLFLAKAKALGRELWVGLETDARVSQLKGENRPINSQQERMATLKKIQYVDHVFLLPSTFSSSETHQKLIEKISPDVLAVSQGSPNISSKRKIMKELGKKLMVVHQNNSHISTTKIVNDTVNER